MSDVTNLLNQFTARYRTALIVKAAVFGILGLDIAAVCWWRLHRLGVSPWWAFGIPSLLTLATVLGLAWWLRARWISPRAAADQLDHTLGLQQRLVTTVEFADAQPPPPLYSLLLDDTTQAFSTQTARVPKPVDRTTAALAVILLLLWLWPMKDTAPVRLANLPGVPPVTPPPQPETPPPPQDQQDQQNQQQQQQEQQQGRNPQDQKSQQDQQGQQGQQNQQNQKNPQDQQNQQGQQGQQDQQDQQGQQGEQGQQRQQEQQGRQGKRDQQRQQGQQGQEKQQGQQGQQGSQGQQGQQGQQGNDSQAQGGLGNQDALKADIQQLLKDLSGELKDLQQQLAQAEVQPPQAGTDTDPQLYGAPEPLDRTQGSSVPIRMQTDTADTKTQRPGGGVGKPSGEISSDGPKTKAEAAALAEESMEETAVTRQRVPPEYQSVFDRLYQRNPQSTETSAP